LIKAVDAGRFDVSFGEANVAQIEAGQVTKRALYIAAGLPFMDGGQQAFKRTIKKSARSAHSGAALSSLRHDVLGHGNLRCLAMIE
jgi:hypothetical protein